MKFPLAPFAAALVSTSTALAWKWAEEPQPLLRYEADRDLAISSTNRALLHRAAVRTDAGAPLAWDQSGRVLWSISGRTLSAQLWVGHTFIERTVDSVEADPDGGLLVDSGWHFIYYLDAAGLPHCAKRAGRSWAGTKMGDEPLTRLLAVNAKTHGVFGYDAPARGIRLYLYSAKTKSWSSSIIATGLGAVGDAAVVDSVGAVLYSSHESVEATVPRHPGAGTMSDPTGIGAWKPWPLVATAWDGKAWTSRVLDETGVPQLPAVRPADRRVFYARRDEPHLTYYFQPHPPRLAESFGSEPGWTGADTYVDDRRYEIKAPQYPILWNSGSSYGLIVRGTFGAGSGWASSYATRTGFALRGPITIVPFYAPVWTETALPPRLASFRAIVNPRKNQLVQHREIVSGEVVREQTGQRLAGYLYRDATGLLAAFCWIARPAATFSGDTYTDYPQLDATFDPANAPAHFADLADAKLRSYAPRGYTTAARQEDSGMTPMWLGYGWLYAPTKDTLPTHFSTDPAAPWVARHLRLPTAVKVRTFGYDYRSAASSQLGVRYQDYRNFGTDFAVPSGLAVDLATGAAFYTQASPASGRDDQSIWVGHTTPPLAGFRAVPDPKWPRTGSPGWVVMVY